MHRFARQNGEVKEEKRLVHPEMYQQRRERGYIMNFKKILLKVTTVTAAAAMMLSTAAFAAEPTVNPCEIDPVWVLSPSRTSDSCSDMAQSTLTSAKSSCETFSGSVTVDGCSSRVRVYYRKGSKSGAKISSYSYFTTTGTKTTALTSSVSYGTVVCGIYNLQYAGAATTATGYLKTP